MTMGHRRSILAASAAFVTGTLALSLWAAGIPIDQIPAKAREALKELAGKNEIVKVEAEKERGVQVYEAAWMAGGVKHEAEVTEDGVLLEMEEGVQPEAIPAAVKAAAEKALPGAPKIIYEKHTVVFYEVKGKVNGKTKELSISPTGKKTADEEEGDEDEDDDDDDNGKK
jgi:hypothetical protein